MKAIGVMALSSVIVGFVAISVAGRHEWAAVTAGVAGSLTAACGAWIAMRRTYLRRPEALTSLMIAAFGAKLVFFGVYVAIGLRGWSLGTRPFVGSLAAAFITLHIVEAYFLGALLKGRAGSVGT